MPMSLTMTSMQMSRNSMCCQWNTLLTQDKETVSWWHDKQTYGRTWWTGNLKCNCRPAGDAGQHCQVMQVSMLTHATVFVNEGTRHWISELVMSVIPLMCKTTFESGLPNYCCATNSRGKAIGETPSHSLASPGLQCSTLVAATHRCLWELPP